MTQTTNYGLNVVEGSDTVNLLTQMNPNTEKIDAQMKTNEEHGIQEATELFTSTVHAITRLKPDAKVFRFTAVSNYTAGETFTVDGVQVTALLTSGEALTTGSFIIGSEVICALRDTLLTVFVNAGTASIAKNAEKLGGELPSYYGTAEDVNTAVSNAGTALETANSVSGAVGNLSSLTTTNKSSCVAAINEVNSNLSKLVLHKLWENPNPNNDFPEQEITLSSNDYDFLLMTCQLEGDISLPKPVTTIVMRGFVYYDFIKVGCENGNYPWIYQRRFSRKSDTTLLIGNGIYQRTNATSTVEYSTILRPLTIYGGKLL